jgi:uncharacterized Fe-S cluster-containing radical SAM superfamily protein
MQSDGTEEGKQGVVPMTPESPFDPLARAAAMESIVMQGGKRKYYRFRASHHYGGVVTADTVGCPFLCAYCWNYHRNESPGNYGTFYSPQEVVEKLTTLARKKNIQLFRMSGAEPILGPASFDHLLQVVSAGRFIIETNGLILGARPELVGRLKGREVSVRISMKGWDARSFALFSGARGEYFEYPLRAFLPLIDAGIDAWPAVMGDLFGTEGIRQLARRMEEMGIRTRIEQEFLERYPFVTANLMRRGWTGDGSS